MLINLESSISAIVRSDYRTADVFKKHNINYCCGGSVLLEDACFMKGLDYQKIVAELEEVVKDINLPASLQFAEWKTDFLIDYIVNIHHAYLYHTVPVLETQLVSFMDNHMKQHPEIKKVFEIFKELSDLLIVHNRNEDSVIFPYIKHLDAAFRRKEPYANLFVRTLRKPLVQVESDHKIISNLLIELTSVTNDYSFPENACTNYQVLYHKLEEFHNDLVLHKHLENNILFPRAIEMEKQLLLN